MIRILRDHYHIMLHSILGQLPEEACGLLAGQGNTSSWVYPVENVLHSPVRFLMEPRQQLEALLDIEEKGWQLLAIYHSHPQGPDSPSKTDVVEYYYPETPCLIWFKGETDWNCRAYLIQEGNIINLNLDYD